MDCASERWLSSADAFIEIQDDVGNDGHGCQIVSIQAGRHFGIADFEQVLPYVMQNFLPVGLKGILLAGLFAAFMSTFDSTINSGAAYLVNDIYKRHLRPDQSSAHYVKASYVSSIAIVIVIDFGLTIVTNSIAAK